MRKGHSLEQQINKLINHINAIGGHAHKNHAARTLDGTFIEGEAFDYEIFHNGNKMCFDAKECNTDKWQLSNAKIMQVKHLKNCKNAGLDAFFLVYFYPLEKLIKFDVDVVLGAIEDGKSYITAEYGTEFKYEF